MASADATRADVVDPLEQHHCRHSREPEEIAFEPLQRGGPARERLRRRIALGSENPVAADACVHDRHAIAVRRVKPPRKHVGPAVVAVQRRQRAVGDRIAERAHDNGVGRRHHIDGVEEIPGSGGVWERGVVLIAAVSSRSRPAEIRRLQRLRVPGHRTARACDVEGHRELAPIHQRSGRQFQFDGIAVAGAARRDRDAALAAERDRAIRALHDVARRCRDADVDRVEGHGLCAERVRQTNAKAIAPQVGFHDQPERLIDGALGRIGKREFHVGLRRRIS